MGLHNIQTNKYTNIQMAVRCCIGPMIDFHEQIIDYVYVQGQKHVFQLSN
jgi:hypothetical protein